MLTDKEKAFFKLNFRITYQPPREIVKPYFFPRKRMTITIEKLFEIAGKKRGSNIAKMLTGMKCQSKRIKIQNRGFIDVYSV